MNTTGQRSRLAEPSPIRGVPVLGTAPMEISQEAVQKHTGSALSSEHVAVSGTASLVDGGSAHRRGSAIVVDGVKPAAQIEPLVTRHSSHPKLLNPDQSREGISFDVGQVEREITRAGPVQAKEESRRTEPIVLGQIPGSHLHSPLQSAAGPHELQKGGDVQRVQEFTNQVLQRMDAAAPLGSTQLHADARRLEVGVATGDLGWVEVHAIAGASGRVDATLHVQSDASAHILASHSPEIASFVHEHSVRLGQLSVGVGTGDGERRRDSQPGERDIQGQRSVRDAEVAKNIMSPRQQYHAADQVTLISLQA